MKQNINVTPAEGTTTFTLLQGTAEPKEHPLQIKVDGHLHAPSRFLNAKKKKYQPVDSHIIVDENAGKITFFGNDDNIRRTEVSGSLKRFGLLDLFNLNGDKKFTPVALAKLFRKLPFMFQNEDAVKLMVNSLINFQATIQTVIETKNDQRGNTKNVLETKVEKQIPAFINFKTPLYEGEQPVEFKAVICCEATSQTVEFYLESPELYQLDISERQRLLDLQISIFSEWGCAVITK